MYLLYAHENNDQKKMDGPKGDVSGAHYSKRMIPSSGCLLVMFEYLHINKHRRPY